MTITLLPSGITISVSFEAYFLSCVRKFHIHSLSSSSTMRIPPILFLFPLLFYCMCLCNHVSLVSGFCLEDQQLLLLQLKNTLISSSTNMVSWNQSLPCCEWNGVTCDEEGHVTGLDLSYETISGGLDNSSALFSLQYLQNLELSGSFFNFTIPPAIKNLKNLTSLDLSDSGFVGQIPMEISQLTKLVTLNLDRSLPLKSEIPNLQKLVQNLTRIRQLYLDGVIISAQGQEWSNALLALPSLEELSMRYCNLSGPINSSLTRLENLSIIYLDGNNFSSTVPESFANLINLTVLSLEDCGLRGIFPQKIFQVPTLSYIDISNNYDLLCSLPDFPPNGSLEILQLSNTKCFGVLPNSISNLMHISSLYLSNCHFDGTLPNSLSNLTKLTYLDLSYNNLIGSVPSFDMLENLTTLDLSHNFLNGQIKLDTMGSLQYLTRLDFSHNSLSVDANAMDANLSSFPTLAYLHLASCELTEFPMFLRNRSIMSELDLSNNQIQGLIPNWIWKEYMSSLNLSRNFLTGFEGSLQNLTITFSSLDLHSNQLQGQILVPRRTNLLDYSSNNFNSLIPRNIGAQLPSIGFLFLSGNNFHGSIPHSLCNVSDLLVLDFSNNNLQGSIPRCLTQNVFNVLNLGNNSINGHIPNTFPRSCGLNTLDLHGNQLGGPIPKSLANCNALEVLDLGNNQINGRFPCLLKKTSTLRVMVLRRNKFQGPITCLNTNGASPVLQIVDLAFNNFSGLLPARDFRTWEAMMHAEDQAVSKSIRVDIGNEYYQDSVTVISKGLEMKLVKILTIFTSIDFSSNKFEGPIPIELMNFKGLHILNLSNNALSGQIPSSIGNLRQLESLDLSNNSLIGEIPKQFATLSFLSFLNLSFNHLVGRIPTGTQLQSFQASSFQGNDGLYGPPLTNDSSYGKPALLPVPPSSFEDHRTIDLNMIISAALGVIFGFGIIIGPLFFWKNWRIRYWKLVDNILCSIFPQLHLEYQRRGGQMYRVLLWRH